MSASDPDTTRADGVAYHLFVAAEEVPVALTALRLLISDEAHEPRIRAVAREVIERLTDGPLTDSDTVLTVPLSPPAMKITHTAVKLLLDDLGREQADERRILRQLLQKLPDEHTIRSIELA